MNGDAFLPPQNSKSLWAQSLLDVVDIEAHKIGKIKTTQYWHRKTFWSESCPLTSGVQKMQGKQLWTCLRRGVINPFREIWPYHVSEQLEIMMKVVVALLDNLKLLRSNPSPW